jgi:hypothetical protein
MRPVSPPRRPAVVVVELDDGAARRLAGGAGRLAQVLRRGDRRPGDLGRAVEVVEVVAEGSIQRSTASRAAPSRRPGPRRLGEVVAVKDLVVELEDPLHHHRHDDQRRALVLGGQRERRLGSNLRLSTIVEDRPCRA